MMRLLICFSLLVVAASPAFAKKVRQPTARAQAPVVVLYPAPAPIDPLYESCGDMSITFPACPGH